MLYMTCAMHFGLRCGALSRFMPLPTIKCLSKNKFLYLGINSKRISTKPYLSRPNPNHITKCCYTSNFTNSSCSDKTSLNDQSTLMDTENENTSHNFGAIRGKQLYDIQNQILQSKLEAELNRVDEISNEEWNNLRRSILEEGESINPNNIDAIILNKCDELQSLKLGKWYFRYLKSTKKPINRATYGNYLRLFYNVQCQCTDDDFEEIYIVYRELLEVHSILDSYTAEKAILALSMTKNWREYENLFQIVKRFYHPSGYVYSAVIKSAFLNKEFNLGWNLMEEMQFQTLNVPDDVFIFWLNTVKDKKSDKDLIRVFKFLCKLNLKPSTVLCDALKQTFEKISHERKGTYTSVYRKGQCKNCYAKLDPAWVTQKEYDQLKTAFLNPVLIGKDIFQKTKPEEFNHFLDYLKKTAPYDIVLDGLNVAYTGHKRGRTNATNAFQLKSVVQHFVIQNKKILVLGRKHMTKWPLREMEYVFNNSCVFLAENLSEDDPFLLYATLYSGLDTRFVSQDLMRGHKFLLADPKLQATFQKWQTRNQYFIWNIQNNGTVHLQEPIPFMQNIQQNSRGDWHIPYQVKENLTTYSKVDNFHKYWLCLVNRATQKNTRSHHREEKNEFNLQRNILQNMRYER